MPRLSKLSRSVEGRVAIVTGAASGMGRATAELFADEGMKVAAVDVAAAGAQATADAIVAAGGTATAYAADLSEADAIDALVSRVQADLGAIDILVNNAGVSVHAPIRADNFEDAWMATFAVNLEAHARLIRACLDDLVRNGDGRVVNIASTEGLAATPNLAAYTASKHGVVGLTRSLAVELGREGVTINCVCPGPINTGMTEDIADEDKEKYARRRVPLRRFGQPEEVAHMTLSLVLPASSYVNGAIIPVDGGLSSKSN